MWRISAIKPEDELIQVCLEMRPPQSVVDAFGPRFEVGKGDVNREGFPIPRMTNAMLAANWLRGV